MKGIYIGIGLMMFTIVALGQKKQQVVFADMEQVVVDGQHTEWESLHDVNQEGLWAYLIGQDKENIYIAVRVQDMMLQNMAVRNGILVSFLSGNKKKKDSQLVFPFPDREVKRAIQQEEFDPEKDYREELIQRSRGYWMDGFPTIRDGLLSFQNQYGIAAKAVVVQDTLFYEAVIPKEKLPIQEGAIKIKLTVNDGLSALVQSLGTNRRTTNAYNPYARGAYRRQGPTKTKNKLTLETVVEGVLK